MAQLQQGFLERNFQQLTRAVQICSQPRNCESEQYNALLQSLDRLKADSALEETSYNNEFERVMGLLSTKTGKEASQADVESRLEETRLQLVAATLGIYNLQEGTALGRPEIDGSLEQRIPLVVDRGGLLYSVTPRYIVILLPSVDGEDHLEELSHALDGISEREALNRSWIIDFSSIEKLPALLLANIIFHISRLNEVNETAHITWLRKDILSDSNTKTLCRLMDLSAIGGFWFSSGSVGKSPA